MAHYAVYRSHDQLHAFLHTYFNQLPVVACGDIIHDGVDIGWNSLTAS